jgi:polyhydroxyalkanoate synthesis regulator phasin
LIKKEAEESGVESSSLSPQGAIIDTTGVLGAVVLDLALTKNVATGLSSAGSFARGAGVLGNTMKTLKSIPISRGMSSAFIAQSSLGYSSGLENTLREAKVAGLSNDEAQELALVAAREMAVLYGLTSFISPQTKATEALFGNINTSSVLKEAINKSKQVAGKVNPKTFGEQIKQIGFKALEYGGEGVKEFIQENVQQVGERFVVNPRINERAAQKIMADTITGEEFVNTSILSFAAGMLIPGLGDVSSGTVSLFKDSNIDKLQMLGLLNANREKSLSLMDSQVADGRMTQEQRDNVVNQMDVYAGSINFIPRDLDADTASVIMQDVYEINKLEQQKQESKIRSVRARLDQKIEEANQRIDSAVNFGDLDSSTKKRLKQEASEQHAPYSTQPSTQQGREARPTETTE